MSIAIVIYPERILLKYSSMFLNIHFNSLFKRIFWLLFLLFLTYFSFLLHFTILISFQYNIKGYDTKGLRRRGVYYEYPTANSISTICSLIEHEILCERKK